MLIRERPHGGPRRHVEIAQGRRTEVAGGAAAAAPMEV